MVKKLQTIMDRVLIRLDETKHHTAGGIMLTDAAETKRNIGTVENIGADVRSVKVGDRVLFHTFDELPALEENMVVVRERSLLGVFTD